MPSPGFNKEQRSTQTRSPMPTGATLHRHNSSKAHQQQIRTLRPSRELITVETFSTSRLAALSFVAVNRTDRQLCHATPSTAEAQHAAYDCSLDCSTRPPTATLGVHVLRCHNEVSGGSAVAVHLHCHSRL
jgi:hypothetical protein